MTVGNRAASRRTPRQPARRPGRSLWRPRLRRAIFGNPGENQRMTWLRSRSRSRCTNTQAVRCTRRQRPATAVIVVSALIAFCSRRTRILAYRRFTTSTTSKPCGAEARPAMATAPHRRGCASQAAGKSCGRRQVAALPPDHEYAYESHPLVKSATALTRNCCAVITGP